MDDIDFSEEGLEKYKVDGLCDFYAVPLAVPKLEKKRFINGKSKKIDDVLKE